eukprot:3331808-Amphidinium_carterae.1
MTPSANWLKPLRGCKQGQLLGKGGATAGLASLTVVGGATTTTTGCNSSGCELVSPASRTENGSVLPTYASNSSAALCSPPSPPLPPPLKDASPSLQRSVSGLRRCSHWTCWPFQACTVPPRQPARDNFTSSSLFPLGSTDRRCMQQFSAGMWWPDVEMSCSVMTSGPDAFKRDHSLLKSARSRLRPALVYKGSDNTMAPLGTTRFRMQATPNATRLWVTMET